MTPDTTAAPAADTAAGHNPLIPALDTTDRALLLRWAADLAPTVGHLKIGLEAYVALGPDLVREVTALAPVFLDLKLHDIPNTVAGAAAAAADLGVAMLTVHASGGAAMVQAAVEAAPDVAILAVTILTSLDDDALGVMGMPSAAEQVPRLAAMAVGAGASGIVCATPEIPAVRAAVGPRAHVVVPGIRPAGAAVDDQARVATPQQALTDGASHIVVGRPITRAEDPAAAARQIVASLR